MEALGKIKEYIKTQNFQAVKTLGDEVLKKQSKKALEKEGQAGGLDLFKSPPKNRLDQVDQQENMLFEQEQMEY